MICGARACSCGHRDSNLASISLHCVTLSTDCTPNLCCATDKCKVVTGGMFRLLFGSLKLRTLLDTLAKVYGLLDSTRDTDFEYRDPAPV